MTIGLLDAQGLSETHAAMRDTARRFAAAEVAPIAAELDESETYPSELYRNIARAGLFGITVPESLGGAGADAHQRNRQTARFEHGGRGDEERHQRRADDEKKVMRRMVAPIGTVGVNGTAAIGVVSPSGAVMNRAGAMSP